MSRALNRLPWYLWVSAWTLAFPEIKNVQPLIKGASLQSKAEEHLIGEMAVAQELDCKG